jgi:peroxiredoxin
MGSNSSRRMLQAGATAPSFTLEDTKGRTVSLAELLTKGPVALAFFKITCPTCQLTLPFLDRMAASKKLQFVAVSQDNRKGTVEFQNEYGVHFTTAIDPAEAGYEVSNAYGISVVPSIFVVEPDGRIAASFDGFSRQEMESLGKRAQIPPFGPGDYVPEWKAG